MAFNLKQWRDQQQESEEEQQQQPSAKIPRHMLLESPSQNHHQQQQQEAAALPLFLSADSQSNKISTHLSAPTYPDHSSPPTAIPTTTTRFPRVGGGGGYCFSIAQWQELELQAVIFRHMMAGASVPPELLHLVKKSLLTSSASPYYLHHYPAHLQQAALLQAGYWGKGAMDPEPGRCRRTDGKKWRCSRDVVAGHKYCERHMHRGRNRSRKPVEFPASVGVGVGVGVGLGGAGAAGGAAGGGGGLGGGGADLVRSVNRSSTTLAANGSVGGGGGGGGGGGAQFSLSGPGAASLDAFQLNQGSSIFRSDKRSLFEPQHDSTQSGDSKSDNTNKVLMHFFDDWPRTLQGSDNAKRSGNSSSVTSLSISTTATNNSSSSDFLRLSTGNGDELGRRGGNEERENGQLSWGDASRWGANPAVSMGGPLAEALRSSTNSSPTSVLHQLPRCPGSDPSFVSA